MKWLTRAGWITAFLVLGAGGAGAVDEDNPAETKQEAAKKRLELAKDGCKRLQGPERERCDNKAEADFLRELDTLRENASPGVMGEGPDREGRQGKPPP